MDIGKHGYSVLTMADIWFEKNVGFIRPIKFLSDLTVGPTYFAKSVVEDRTSVVLT